MKAKLSIVAMLFFLVIGTMAVGTSAMYSNKIEIGSGSVVSSPMSPTLRTWQETNRLQREYLEAKTNEDKNEVLNGATYFSNDTAREALVYGNGRLGGAWLKVEDKIFANIGNSHKDSHNTHYIQTYFSNVCENIYINDEDSSKNRVCGDCKVCNEGFVPILFLHTNSAVSKNWQSCAVWNENDGIWYEYQGKGSFMMTTFYYFNLEQVTSSAKSWKSYKKGLATNSDWRALGTVK